jgi:hypothetical protein
MMMTNPTSESRIPVFALEIDRDGCMTHKSIDPSHEGQLTNCLLTKLYHGVRVATVEVPTEPMDGCEQAMVEQALARLDIDGVRYSLIGASGSAKEGKFYAVDTGHEKKVAERFRFAPQAAMTYFGILVSPCKVLIEEPECRVLVVEDHELGTNDCRGWISRSLFLKLQRKQKAELLEKEMARRLARLAGERGADAQDEDVSLSDEEAQAVREAAERRIHSKVLRPHRLYQFRLAFDRTQAKGSFKVMEDDVAAKLEADVILPKSSVKPKYQGGMVRTIRSFMGDRQAHAYRGPAVIGIRDVSRNLEFQSSYTLVEHAPVDSIELEVKPYALENIERVRKAYEENDFTQLFELIGTQESQSVPEAGEQPDPAFTSSEYTVANAVLVADGTGYCLKHPFVNHHLQKVLAKWAYRVSTSGGFRLPGFALADDGYLFLRGQEIVSGSDWIPKDGAITASPSRRALVVRYPIRMKEDLLPVTNLTSAEIVALFGESLGASGCGMTEEEVSGIAKGQLQLEGTLTLHSETAALNGGDFDFDMVCVVEGDRFPRFVADRVAYRPQHTAQKKKAPKAPSPWWNLPQVAMQARGNQIGAITDLKTSCLAKGRTDLARLLVDELQNALDQLKHGTEPNQEVIRSIRNEVKQAPWLKLKAKRRITDMDEHIAVDDSDKVGKLYNFLRKELGRFFGEVAVRPLSDFRGLVGGDRFTPEIYDECFRINRYYGSVVKQVAERRQILSAELTAAQNEVETAGEDVDARKRALFRRNQAASALHLFDKRSGEDMKALVNQVRAWGQSKNGTRMAYLSALHAIVCRDRKPTQEQPAVASTGSIVFYAFPQEVVDQIAERSGGRAVVVDVPELADGEIEIDQDGRIFLVGNPTMAEQNCQTLVFLAQVTKAGEVFFNRDSRGCPLAVRRIRPFAIREGRGRIEGGKAVFPETMQRPKVPIKRIEELQANN